MNSPTIRSLISAGCVACASIKSSQNRLLAPEKLRLISSRVGVAEIFLVHYEMTFCYSFPSPQFHSPLFLHDISLFYLPPTKQNALSSHFPPPVPSLKSCSHILALNSLSVLSRAMNVLGTSNYSATGSLVT